MKGFQLEQYVEELKYLVSQDSGRYHRPGVTAMAEFFEERFRALGLWVERVYDGAEDFAPAVVARNCGQEEPLDFLLVAHMDTVFPVGEAERRPMTVEEDGTAHGPGVSDCKAGCLMIYYQVKALLEQKVPCKFCVILNSDEEVGSPHSSDLIYRTSLNSRYCFIYEPGRPNGGFVVQRKGTLSYTLRFYGIPAHSGSAPQNGASAIVEMAKWIDKIDALNDYELGRVVNIGVCRGGSAPNIIPEYAECEVNCRYPHPDTLKELRQLVAEMQRSPFNPRVRIEVTEWKDSSKPAMYPTEKTRRLMEILEETGARMDYPIQFVASGGGSDGNRSAAQVPVLDACGPIGSRAHTPQEYSRTDSVERRLELLEQLLIRLL